MIPDWVMLLVSVTSPLLVAIFGGWLVTQRYYSQRWWDQKALAYSNTLSALAKIGNELERNFAAERRQKVLPEDQDKELERERLLGYSEITKQIYLGQIGMCREATNELEELLEELQIIPYKIFQEHKTNNYEIELASSLSVVRETANKISALAKRDLQN